jgi:hypothetical protein
MYTPASNMDSEDILGVMGGEKLGVVYGKVRCGG